MIVLGEEDVRMASRGCQPSIDCAVGTRAIHGHFNLATREETSKICQNQFYVRVVATWNSLQECI